MRINFVCLNGISWRLIDGGWNGLVCFLLLLGYGRQRPSSAGQFHSKNVSILSAACPLLFFNQLQEEPAPIVQLSFIVCLSLYQSALLSLICLIPFMLLNV